MEQKPISRARIKQLLKEDPRVKTVSKPAIDWIIAVAECAAKSLAAQGGLTPSGQLRAPRMDPGLMARHITKPQDQAAAAGVELAQDPGAPAWGPREDWQLAVRSGATKLSFEKWKEQRK